MATLSEPWRMITSGFAHSDNLAGDPTSIFHIALNMYTLYILGNLLEPVLGTRRFTLLYMLSIFGGSVAVLVFGDPVGGVLGASGGVFGLMGAYFVVLRTLGQNNGSIAGVIAINLVFSHKDRVRLNDELQNIYKPTDRPCYWVTPGPCRAEETLPQAMWLYEGLELYACTKASGWRNRWPYTVVAVDETTATLQAKDAAEPMRPLPHATVAALCRLGFCRSYHAAQGLEWPRVRLHGWDSPHFTLSHLLVGMSRCLRSDALDFGPGRYE